jgi:hypothetical protein
MATAQLSYDAIPDALRKAKESAVAQFFTPTAGPTAFAAYAVTTSLPTNLVGVGLGRKVTKGRLTAQHCVRFYVVKKVHKGALSAETLLPTHIGKLATDVVESGQFHAFSSGVASRKRRRPARPGCSIGFKFVGHDTNMVMAGTLGAVGSFKGQTVILSNNHVLADENRLAQGSPIFQPGLLDGGQVSTDVIAHLTKFVALSSAHPNKVDCAIAEVVGLNTVSARILLPIGKLKSGVPLVAQEQLAVYKVGRTSGYTKGRITDLSADVKITYETGVLAFSDQILIEGDSGPFSAAGDSGSLIVARTTKRPVALLFAGSPSHTIANHIGDVLTALGITLVV